MVGFCGNVRSEVALEAAGLGRCLASVWPVTAAPKNGNTVVTSKRRNAPMQKGVW